MCGEGGGWQRLTPSGSTSSFALIKTWTTATQRGRFYLVYTFQGSWGGKLSRNQKAWKGILYCTLWLAHKLTLPELSYTAQDYLPVNGTTHTDPSTPTSTNGQDNHSQTGQLCSCGFLYRWDSMPGQADNKNEPGDCSVLNSLNCTG